MCDFTLYYNNHLDAPAYKVLKAQVATRKDYHIIHNYNEFAIDVYLLLDDENSKTIAFDWDNTVGADVEFFSGLMDAFLRNGFKPVICSLRGPEQENYDEMITKLNRTDIEIHLTDGISKLKFMKQQGGHVNLWIDDFYPGICRHANPLLTRNKIEYGKL